jgi:2-phospho-L-lactate guanylyltransferase
MGLSSIEELTRRSDLRRGVCALVAIKERLRCKTRLSAALPGEARIGLVRSMLATVLSAAAAARSVRQIMVVSPERDSVPAEVPVLADTGEGLNSALTQALASLRDVGCRELLILPADLPKITATDIDQLVRTGRAGGCAIAPDAAGVGTNALYLASAHPFPFRFGPDSCRLHLQAAERAGMRPQIIRLPGLEFDVDTPADLRLLDGERWLARLQA